MIRWGTAALLLISLSACASPARVIIVPTLAELATSTPVPTDTAVSTPTVTAVPPTVTPTLTSTPTITATMQRDLQMETMQAQFTHLNATIFTLMTATPTTAPTATITPQPAVVNLPPQQFSVRGTGELRQCPNRTCLEITPLPEGTVILVDALIYGEEVDFGNALWYRVQWTNGVTGYIFSAGIVPIPPTLPGTMSFPTLTSPTLPTDANPISLPIDSSLCPSADAHCSTLLTCDQARACLAAGNRSLDRDGDGVPCETLCAGQ